MSTGVQKGLQIMITLIIFLLILNIVFSIVGGKDVELVNKLVRVLSLQFVGN